MPITIQNNKLQIRNAEGNYVNIDAVSDATVAEWIIEINATAQTQISAIEQKGQETYASIPDNYSDLADGAVRADITQAFTDVQKATARGNIDAARVKEVSDLRSDLSNIEAEI